MPGHGLGTASCSASNGDEPEADAEGLGDVSTDGDGEADGGMLAEGDGDAAGALGVVDGAAIEALAPQARPMTAPRTGASGLHGR